MRNRYACLFVVALVGGLGMSAGAIELKLIAGHDPDADQGISMNLSETGIVSIYMKIFENDGNVSFVNVFLDASPLGNRESVGYDVLGNEFKMQRNDGSGWFRNVGSSDSRNIELYALIAADDDGGDPIGTDGPWEGVVDSIILHAINEGEQAIYFEGPETADTFPRPPGVFDRNNVEHPYAVNLQIPGFIWFGNAWADKNANGGEGFDSPFMAETPEPTSLALLTIGGLGLMRRRRSSE